LGARGLSDDDVGSATSAVAAVSVDAGTVVSVGSLMITWLDEGGRRP
jgi:hypothetical protein